MAIYHFSVQVIGRSAGHSAIKAAAYRSGEKLTKEAAPQNGVVAAAAYRSGEELAQSDEVYNYTRKQGITHTEILAPETAPAWATDRQTLWNEVERAEKRKDAQLARDINLALPRELGFEQQRDLLQTYVQQQFVERGMVADIAMHETSGHNPHAHILLTMREIGPEGFGPKNRDWNQRDTLQGWREAWETATNEALSETDSGAQVSHKTLAAQGIDRVPQLHQGKAATALQRRDQATRRGVEQGRRSRDNAFRDAFNGMGSNRFVKEAEDLGVYDAYEQDFQDAPGHGRGSSERDTGGPDYG